MLGKTPDTRQQQGTTGDRFEASFRMSQAHVPAPPVVDKGHGTCREIATFQVVGGVTAPARLILEFVETVLAIGTIAIQLPMASSG